MHLPILHDDPWHVLIQHQCSKQSVQSNLRNKKFQGRLVMLDPDPDQSHWVLFRINLHVKNHDIFSRQTLEQSWSLWLVKILRENLAAWHNLQNFPPSRPVQCFGFAVPLPDLPRKEDFPPPCEVKACKLCTGRVCVNILSFQLSEKIMNGF